MITKIALKNVASYKQETTLETDKKINLIYGLNGVGKSIMSKYLQNSTNEEFSDCHIAPEINSDEVEILVYNQKYIEENFYNSPALGGIFSLSKGNKEAIEVIDKAKSEITRLSNLNDIENRGKTDLDNNFQKKRETAIDTIWAIKTDYTGGDRVLEYCLKGLMGKKELLFDHIRKIPKPSAPIKDIDEIKKEAQIFKNDTPKIEELPLVQFHSKMLETDPILQRAIIGSKNSTFSELIQQLDSSDWVRAGMKYISDDKNDIDKCPFCQQPIDKNCVIRELTKCFDKTYENDKNKLDTILSSYRDLLEKVKEYPEFETTPILENLKNAYLLAYKEFKSCIDRNFDSLKRKIETPSVAISLTDSSVSLSKLNGIISQANKKIKDFNTKIDKKEETLNQLKEEFWNNMRSNYDPIISNFEKSEKDYNKNSQLIEDKIKLNNKKINKQNEIIIVKQKDIINIQEAISHINTGLLELGINSFEIVEFKEGNENNLYRIKRGDDTNNIFKSLSEGEKMIISFLYFIEECKGRKAVAESQKKKIIVIDDPISSLSHIYVFNIGRLIHNEFLGSNNYEQIFVLTHSLYFFYELTYINKDRREANQKLFRIYKNETGSFISEMKYEEIQNDYQSYWLIIKDDKQAPALIANCMRNIIDYFFNFIEKTDFNNVFQRPRLKCNKFQAFNRFMNRESHSLGQNIFDIKEFDYNSFKEAFRLVFEESGYEEHYKKMMK